MSTWRSHNMVGFPDLVSSYKPAMKDTHFSVIEARFIFRIFVAGGLYMWGSDQPFPELSCLHKNVENIFGGFGRCIALHKDGPMYMWTNSCHSPIHLESVMKGQRTKYCELGPTRCIFVTDNNCYWLWDYQEPSASRLEALDGVPFGGVCCRFASVSETHPLPNSNSFHRGFCERRRESWGRHQDRLLRTSVFSRGICSH